MGRPRLYNDKLSFNLVAKLTAADGKRWKRVWKDKDYDNGSAMLRDLILAYIEKHEKKQVKKA